MAIEEIHHQAEVPPAEAFDPTDSWDPLHNASAPELHWSRSNVAEAVPGVPTPLSWSVWEASVERGMRKVAYRMGVLEVAERELPTAPDRRYVRAFYGRPAVAVQFLTMLGDRVPATSGQEVARSILGYVPEDMRFAPTRRRYPAVAWRLPRAYFAIPGQVRAAAEQTDRWYGTEIERTAHLDLAGAREQFRVGGALFEQMLTLQLAAFLIVVEPTYSALERLVTAAGVGDVSVLSGYGGAEMIGLVDDLWRVSRGVQGIEAVVARHGYHGPAEGELSSRVWREDSSPLANLLVDYRAMADDADPAAREQARARARGEARREILAAVPARRRVAARVLLELAGRNIPLRGVAKGAFLQAFDVTRAAARRLGELLAAEQALDEPDDVFHLTAAEIGGSSLPAEVKDLVAARRARREAYRSLELPGHWRGMPIPAPAGEPAVPDGPLTGVGVSAGVAEGPARVLASPDFVDVEPGEILVAAMTDPSWSSVMFVSAGLVMDTGGALSHAAVVARELGIPCVVNTQTGTRAIRTGDHIRIDGAAGTVDILSS